MPLVALDYHRSAGGNLSAHGKLLVDEKYGEDRTGGTTVGLKQFAAELHVVVQNAKSYSTANAIAVVPGTVHRYSNELGEMLSKVTRLPLVRLHRDVGRAFTVAGECEDRTLILIDDVYRSGRTLRDAASCLFDAGAKEVLGLAVTCTVSRTELPCHHRVPAADAHLPTVVSL